MVTFDLLVLRVGNGNTIVVAVGVGANVGGLLVGRSLVSSCIHRDLALGLLAPDIAGVVNIVPSSLGKKLATCTSTYTTCSWPMI